MLKQLITENTFWFARY